MYCYKSLHDKLKLDEKANALFANIISDEGRHIAYIGSMIDEKRREIGEHDWKDEYLPFCEQMTQYARNMFEAQKRGPNFSSFTSMDIDVAAFCDLASSDISKRIALQ